MFDVGNDFPANQVMCYSGFGFAERQILFSDVKWIHGGSGVMEHAMVIVSPLRRSVQSILMRQSLTIIMVQFKCNAQGQWFHLNADESCNEVYRFLSQDFSISSN